MSYLIIKNIRIQHANMMSSNYALTAAQPMAISLFAHALGLKTKTKFSGVGVVYHDAQPLGEPADFALKNYKFLPQQRRGAMFVNDGDYAGNKSAMNLGLQPVATMHLEISLVLPFEGRSPGRVDRALSSMRIAGGSIISYQPPEIVDALDEINLPPGFWLIERRDLMDSHDPIGSFIDRISDRRYSWLCGACLGYALTTEKSVERHGIRSNEHGDFYPHAFAEPMLGLTQFVSTRAIDSKKELPLWSSFWLQDDIFVVQNSFKRFAEIGG